MCGWRSWWGGHPSPALSRLGASANGSGGRAPTHSALETLREPQGERTRPGMDSCLRRNNGYTKVTPRRTFGPIARERRGSRGWGIARGFRPARVTVPLDPSRASGRADPPTVLDRSYCVSRLSGWHDGYARLLSGERGLGWESGRPRRFDNVDHPPLDPSTPFRVSGPATAGQPRGFAPTGDKKEGDQPVAPTGNRTRRSPARG